MLDTAQLIPAYGMNLGTVGFLMNRYRPGTNLKRRLAQARPISIRPIRMQAVTQTGATCHWCANNEVSLLREKSQTAQIEVSVDDRVRIEELVCDGVLLATPAGPTAYKLSANGPILPLNSNSMAPTPTPKTHHVGKGGVW